MYKKLFFLITLVLVLGLASNASAGLVALWNFDNSDATDAFGGHHGTVQSVGPNSVTFAWDTGPAGSMGLPMDSNVAVFPGDPCCMINCGGGKLLPADACTWADFWNQDTITIAAWLKTDGLFTPGIKYQYAFAKENMWRMSRWSDKRHMRVYLASPPGSSLGGTLEADPCDVADDSQWHHMAATLDGTKKTIYWDGDISSSESASGNLKTTTTYDIQISGGTEGNPERTWKGRIDDVRLYNSAEAQITIRQWARNYRGFNPVPQDTAVELEVTLPSVSWTASSIKVDDHKVYMGTNEAWVTDACSLVDRGFIGSTTPTYIGAPIGSLAYITTYYWRVDTNDNGAIHSEGDVWEFTTKPAWAENPWPWDGCKYVGLAQQISWKIGADACDTDLYISTTQQWVIDACDSILTNIVAPTNTHSPALAVDNTYYWRADSNADTMYTNGQVWSFSTDATSPEAGLVGYYPMEEKYGSSSVTWDISGNLHHGTLVQGDVGTSIDIVADAERGSNVLKTDIATAGLVNSALDLGGNADDVDDPCWGYVAQDQMTVMMWAKPEEFHGTDYIYTRGNNIQLTHCNPDGRIRYYSSTLDDSTTYGPVWDVGNWQHIALTFENYVVSDVNEKCIYVNGNLVQTDATTGPTGGDPLGTHANTLVIGGRLDAGYNDRGYDGLLDDVKIYDIRLAGWKILRYVADCNTCVGDLDANSVVNLDDLSIMIGNLTAVRIRTGEWVINPGDPEWENCKDMDSFCGEGRDGQIDLADLNRMLGNLTWEKIMTGNWFYPCGKYTP